MQSYDYTNRSMNLEPTLIDPAHARREDDDMAAADLIEAFSNHQRFCGFTPPTIKRRRWTLSHLAAHAAPRPLLDVTKNDVIDFLSARPSAATRYSLLSDIRQFFLWAHDNDLTINDPCIKIGKIRKPTREPTPLTLEHINLALANTRPRTRLMIMLGALAGLRVSEIAALHVDNLGQPGIISVRQGKGSKDRTVPLSSELAAELERWKARGRIGADGWVFRGATPGGVSSSIRTVFQRLGIPNRPHDLRATFATTTAERSGGNLMQVAKLLGHVSVTTTQRYVRWDQDGADLVEALYPPDDAA